ncbi:hypothetical protein Tco_0375846 [Tanacetum coccineum]
MKYNDHVMGNESQKHKDDKSVDGIGKNRVRSGCESEKIGENNTEERIAKNENRGISSKESRDAEKDVSDKVAEAESDAMESHACNVSVCDNVSKNRNDVVHVNGSNEDISKCFDDNINTSEDDKEKSYAKTLSKINTERNQMFVVPTVINSKGDKNIRRMWGKYGLKDIIVDVDAMCFFKFKGEEGMKYIIDQSPWLVNEKPLIVGEAINDGSNDFRYCKEGSGRLGYVRVLVEVDARKNFLDKVEINYVDDQKNVKMSKWVKVEYSWKPDRCKVPNKVEREGFVEVRNIKNKNGIARGVNNRHQGNEQVNNMNNMFNQVKYAFNPKVPNPKPVAAEHNVNLNKSPKKSCTDDPNSLEKIWKISKENVEDMRKNANKYVVLSEEENEVEEVDPLIDKKFDLRGNGKEGETGAVRFDYLMDTKIVSCNIRGICNEFKQKEVKKFIVAEKVQVFNVVHSSTSCRIVIGWNSNLVDVMMVPSCRQNFVSNQPWDLMGDFNVIIKPEEQSNGSSGLNNEICEFRDAINSMEIDDLCSSGFNWTKSLKNPLL